MGTAKVFLSMRKLCSDQLRMSLIIHSYTSCVYSPLSDTNDSNGLVELPIGRPTR